jgi:hypothetical protein
MSTTRKDRESMFSDIHRRDEIVRTIATLAATHKASLRSAADRLNARLEPMVEAQRARARSGVARRLALLEVARQYFLDSLNGPPSLCALSSLDLDTDVPPGFDPACLGVRGRAPEWMKRCYELAREFDVEYVCEFNYYVMYMRNLHDGTWGDYTFPKPVDLTQITAGEAWMMLQTRPLKKHGAAPRPQSDLEHWEADTNPDAAEVWAENYVKALSEIACDMIDENMERILTLDDAWDVVIVALTLMSPTFDPAAAGVRGMPPWEFPEEGFWWRTRSFPTFVWEGQSSNIGLLAELAYRAANVIDPATLSNMRPPLSPVELQPLLEDFLTREGTAAAIRKAVDMDRSARVWTRAMLCKVAGIGDKTFGRIRGKTSRPPLEQGQRDGVYSENDVRLLISAARKLADGKQHWAPAAARWEAMLQGSPFASPR